MKKNTMMRIASFLLIAVLLSTSAISGTYAKYVTTETAMDSARVAKWGVQIEAAGTTFAETYRDPAESSVTVRSDLTHGSINDLVAPGTQGKMAEIKLSGKPEVDCTVSYLVKKFDISGWYDADSNFYFPIVITIVHNGISHTVNMATHTSEADVEMAVTDLINGFSKDYDANTDLGTIQADHLDISWVWAFETGTNEAEKAANDIRDTYLGDCAAGLYSGKGAATIEFEFDVIVTQID